MPGGRLWTKEEDDLLRRIYTSRGAQGALKSLKRKGYVRTLDAIKKRAATLNIYITSGESRGTIPLWHVHPWDSRTDNKHRAHPSAIRAAKADGVLERSMVYPYTLMVPEDWGERYIQRLAEYEAELRRTIAAGWLSTAEAAKLFHVRVATLRSMISPSRVVQRRGLLAEYCERIERRTFRVRTTYRTYWHPEQTRHEGAAYRIARARSSWHAARAQPG